MTDTRVKPNKPWMKILLVVSLGLNLAVAGMFIGARFSGHGTRPGLPHAGGLGLHVLMRALPDEKRAEVRRHFRRNRAEMRKNGDAGRMSLEKIGAAITAQPFSAQDLNEAFGNQRAHIADITQDAQSAFVAIIASMTDTERAQYVETMKTQRKNHRNNRKHRQGKQ